MNNIEIPVKIFSHFNMFFLYGTIAKSCNLKDSIFSFVFRYYIKIEKFEIRLKQILISNSFKQYFSFKFSGSPNFRITAIDSISPFFFGSCKIYLRTIRILLSKAMNISKIFLFSFKPSFRRSCFPIIFMIHKNFFPVFCIILSCPIPRYFPPALFCNHIKSIS